MFSSFSLSTVSLTLCYCLRLLLTVVAVPPKVYWHTSLPHKINANSWSCMHDRIHTQRRQSFTLTCMYSFLSYCFYGLIYQDQLPFHRRCIKCQGRTWWGLTEAVDKIWHLNFHLHLMQERQEGIPCWAPWVWVCSFFGRCRKYCKGYSHEDWREEGVMLV